MTRSILYILLLSALISSCTSTKKMIYLQDELPDMSKVNDSYIKSLQIRNQPYLLRPNDRLKISVFSLTDQRANFLKDHQLELTINEAGAILMPVIGPIEIAGLSTKESELKIASVLKEYLKSPNVSVRLSNFNITLLGEVNRQGTYAVQEPSISLLNAFGMAGGLTENANMQNIRVVRNEKDSSSIFRLNMLEDNILTSPYYHLLPNDIVIINPRKAKSSNQDRIAIISLVVSVISGTAWLIAR